MIADKTASLLATSGAFGALFGGGQEYVEVLRSYGEKVGVAFQVADDVIDVTGAQVRSGKTPGTDLREGVPTLPILLMRDAAAGGRQGGGSGAGTGRRGPGRGRGPGPRGCRGGREPGHEPGLGRGPALGRRRHRGPGPAAGGNRQGHRLAAFADAVVTREL